MKVNIPTYSERQLNEFAAKEWDKTLMYLRNHFSLSEDDCKDIFQESFIILYNNIQNGKLDGLTSSLSTYFMGICKNKAYEVLRSNGKTVNPEDELSLSVLSGEFMSDRIDALLSLENEDDSLEIRKDSLVRQIVKDLPAPCDKLLWGFYRDNLSMKTLAEMFNYSGESGVKVTKHRCCEKFKNRFSELKNNLF